MQNGGTWLLLIARKVFDSRLMKDTTKYNFTFPSTPLLFLSHLLSPPPYVKLRKSSSHPPLYPHLLAGDADTFSLGIGILDHSRVIIPLQPSTV